jgi:hypothetical protein
MASPGAASDQSMTPVTSSPSVNTWVICRSPWMNTGFQGRPVEAGRQLPRLEQLGDQFRREPVRLVQVPQVRFGQWPASAELGQYAAAADE